MSPLLRLLPAAALALAVTSAEMAGAQQGGTTVDLKLVLAVDVSQSMDYDEHALQKNGYVEAFRSADVIHALTSGPAGRIAVTYMEWGGNFPVNVLIPWTVIDSPDAAHAFADKLSKEGVNDMERTSISNAIYSAADMLDDPRYTSKRRVIDVSGDGANNAGPPIEEARKWVLAKGIVINGLPILLNKPKRYYDIDHLDRYYKACVIGGQGAFIAPVFDLKQLAATVRKKLVMEIAGLDAPTGAPAIQFAEAQAPLAQPGWRLTHVQLKLPTEKADCFAGEKALGYGFP